MRYGDDDMNNEIELKDALKEAVGKGVFTIRDVPLLGYQEWNMSPQASGTRAYVSSGLSIGDTITDGGNTAADSLAGWYMVNEYGEWVRMGDLTSKWDNTIADVKTTSQYDYEELDEWDDLPSSIQDAILSLECDNVLPDADRIIITNDRYYQIDHNGSFGHTIVDTEQYKFDDFSCGFDSETKSLCVRVYEYENEDEQRYEWPAMIECEACGRGNSTFGLIGKEIVCDCGHRNRIA